MMARTPRQGLRTTGPGCAGGSAYGPASALPVGWQGHGEAAASPGKADDRLRDPRIGGSPEANLIERVDEDRRQRPGAEAAIAEPVAREPTDVGVARHAASDEPEIADGAHPAERTEQPDTVHGRRVSGQAGDGVAQAIHGAQKGERRRGVGRGRGR